MAQVLSNSEPFAGRVARSTCDFRDINFNFTKKTPPLEKGEWSGRHPVFGNARTYQSQASWGHGAFGKCLNGLIFVFQRQRQKTERKDSHTDAPKNTTVMRVIFFPFQGWDWQIIIEVEQGEQQSLRIRSSWGQCLSCLLACLLAALWPMKWCRKNLKFAACLGLGRGLGLLLP